jgi:putative transposase
MSSDSIFYMAQAGCQWHLLPKISRRIRRCSGIRRTARQWVWQTINHVLLMDVREATGRKASPTAGVVGGESVKTTESGGPRGYAAEKMIKGRKRQLSSPTSSAVGLG